MDSNINIFELASRLKLRFETPKGEISAEDLWTLPLTSSTGKLSLDSVTRHVYMRVQETKTMVSFVEDAVDDATSRIEQLRFDILKHIIAVRKEENRIAALARERSETKARIRELIANKQDEALASKSVEELTALLSSL